MAILNDLKLKRLKNRSKMIKKAAKSSPAIIPPITAGRRGNICAAYTVANTIDKIVKKIRINASEIFIEPQYYFIKVLDRSIVFS